MSGKLYICPTPIGNLEDITYRTLRILKEVDLIAAEDTRHSIKLLNHFEISKPLTSYHEHNKDSKGDYLINKLIDGEESAESRGAERGYRVLFSDKCSERHGGAWIWRESDYKEAVEAGSR